MKKTELGDKRPLSHGYIVNRISKKAEQDEIQKQTDDFIASGGKIKSIASNVMKLGVKGSVALRINPNCDDERFKTK